MFMAMTGDGRLVTEKNGKRENDFHQSPAVSESTRTDWRGRRYRVRKLGKGEPGDGEGAVPHEKHRTTATQMSWTVGVLEHR